MLSICAGFPSSTVLLLCTRSLLSPLYLLVYSLCAKLGCTGRLPHGGFSFLVEWILAEQATRGFQALKIREDRFIIDDCDSSSVVPGQIRALGLMM